MNVKDLLELSRTRHFRIFNQDGCLLFRTIVGDRSSGVTDRDYAIEKFGSCKILSFEVDSLSLSPSFLKVVIDDRSN